MFNEPFEDAVQSNFVSESGLHNPFGKEVLVFDHAVNDEERGHVSFAFRDFIFRIKSQIHYLSRTGVGLQRIGDGVNALNIQVWSVRQRTVFCYENNGCPLFDDFRRRFPLIYANASDANAYAMKFFSLSPTCAVNEEAARNRNLFERNHDPCSLSGNCGIRAGLRGVGANLCGPGTLPCLDDRIAQMRSLVAHALGLSGDVPCLPPHDGGLNPQGFQSSDRNTDSANSNDGQCYCADKPGDSDNPFDRTVGFIWCSDYDFLIVVRLFPVACCIGGGASKNPGIFYFFVGFGLFLIMSGGLLLGLPVLWGISLLKDTETNPYAKCEGSIRIVTIHFTIYACISEVRESVMAIESSIEWTDATWNPVRGCTKISPGCKHCYAETFAERFRGVKGHPYEQGFDPRLIPEKLAEPLRWRQPKMIFVNSMGDLFHDFVPDDYIVDVATVMAKANRHTYQVLTKRSERLCSLLNSKLKFAAQQPHIWWGVSVEDKKYGVPRIADLQKAKAAVRFLSVEPLLENLGELNLRHIDWMIVGGESGPGARPMQEDWVLSLRNQCRKNKVAFFFKQWGGVRKSKTGRHLQGRTYDEFPERACRPVMTAEACLTAAREIESRYPPRITPPSLIRLTPSLA